MRKLTKPFCISRNWWYQHQSWLSQTLVFLLLLRWMLDPGVGAVLMQTDQPVAFLSKALGPNHQKLSIYQKEFLALIMAVEKWRQYFQTNEFIYQDRSQESFLPQWAKSCYIIQIIAAYEGWNVSGVPIGAQIRRCHFIFSWITSWTRNQRLKSVPKERRMKLSRGIPLLTRGPRQRVSEAQASAPARGGHEHGEKMAEPALQNLGRVCS